ncbi:helix-turn-helix domain-containing protein [Lacticaseibacillus paracasei]|uniref:helix-turn-helix domain-containing protein n=1 Tax=Lacticaseibacillus paracasei TaxID=1597 RepID=UPI001C46D74C|nr:helix-turn-helix transcriptional regulator [Lacticaseibacillus paracasei]QXJ68574.1 helix-turn-helix domain-containing protein [Lacticaseibacillus paracasei subsp. paracasei]
MIQSVGKLVHKHRVAQKLTIAELAEKANVSDSYVSRLELGTVRDTHVSKLKRVADALEVNLADLFEETELDPFTVELIHKLVSLPTSQRAEVSKSILNLITILK